MTVKKQCIFLQLLIDRWNKRQSFFKCTKHEMLVDLRSRDIYKRLDAKVVMILHSVCLGKDLILFQISIEFPKVAKYELRVHQVMHSLYIVTRFDSDHQRLCIKDINPFL